MYLIASVKIVELLGLHTVYCTYEYLCFQHIPKFEYFLYKRLVRILGLCKTLAEVSSILTFLIFRAVELFMYHLIFQMRTMERGDFRIPVDFFCLNPGSEPQVYCSRFISQTKFDNPVNQFFDIC